MNNDFNLNEDMINNLKSAMNQNGNSNNMDQIKNMVDKGDLNSAISQISPEMIQNFSKMLSNNQSNNQTNNTTNSATSGVQNNENNTNTTTATSNNENNNANGFDFSNIDMSTIMKMSSAFGQMNHKNDPRSNLLNSLKPYMRDEKKGKIDSYMSLLNMSKITDVLKNNNSKENPNA